MIPGEAEEPDVSQQQGHLREARSRGRGARLLGLKAARYRKALTQSELATLAGVSPSSVRALEVGLRTAYPKTVKKLARALDVETEEIVGQ